VDVDPFGVDVDPFGVDVDCSGSGPVTTVNVALMPGCNVHTKGYWPGLDGAVNIADSSGAMEEVRKEPSSATTSCGTGSMLCTVIVVPGSTTRSEL